MKLLGWTGDMGACRFYRIEEPMRAMQERYQHDATVTNSPDPDMQLDVIGTQRIWEPSTLVLWRAIREDGRLGMVYDMDDDLWNVPDDNPAFEYFANPVLRNGLRYHMLLAHVITASTDKLAERLIEELGDRHPPIIVMPNTIPKKLLTMRRQGSTDGLVRVGWTGSATHKRDWEDAASYVNRVKSRHSNVRIITAGYQPPNLSTDHHLGWTALMDEHYDRLTQFDIGLAPLRPTLFNQSKSHIKALEMMALGIPVVASHSEAYEDLIVHGENGFLVRRPHEWTTYVSRLVEDSGLRAQMSSAARQTASHYTAENYADLWNDVYRFAIKEAHESQR